jgi:Flp pilus assembly secretin CpaC
MRKWIIAILTLTFVSCATPGKKAEADCACANDSLTEAKITRLPIGTDKFVDLPFEPAHAGIFVGNPDVLKATIAKAGNRVQLVLQPLRAGATNVTAMDSKGEIKYQGQFQVSAIDLNDLANQLIELLKDTKNANVKLLKDKVVIDGELLTVAHASRIAAIIGNDTYAPHVLNLTRLSPQFFTDLAARAQEEIRKHAPTASVRAVNGQLWLEGKVDTTDQANQAAKVASLMLPDALPEDPLVESAGGSELGGKPGAKPSAKVLPPRAMVQNFLTIK